MSLLFKFWLLAGVIFLLPACTIYTEKQSEALSQAVYLADDSFEAGRFDITDVALNEAVKIVKPPKKRQQVKPIFKTPEKSDPQFKIPDPIKLQIENTNKQETEIGDKRIIIVPERFKDQQVIVVNSEDYNELLKDKKILEQLQGDYKTLKTLKKNVEEELAKQTAYANKMVIELNKLQKDIIAKNLLILRLYLVIGALVATIGGGVYLRMKGIL